MASSKENVLAQVFLAIGHGAGDVTLSEESFDWLYDRYSKWLDTETSQKDTPLDVWHKEGPIFLKRFRAIGRALGNQGLGATSPSAKGIEEIVCSVEGESDCPYCPSPNG